MRKLLIVLGIALLPSISHATACSSNWPWDLDGVCADFTTGNPQILSLQAQIPADSGGSYPQLSTESLTAAGLSACIGGGDVDYRCVDSAVINYLKANPITQSKAYEGTTQRTSSFPIFKSATVSSGTAVFNLTSDGTSGGAALCPNGVIQDSVTVGVSDSAASYQMAWAFSNSNKTLTVTTNKLTTANILTGILGQASGNGSVVKLQVWCY